MHQHDIRQLCSPIPLKPTIMLLPRLIRQRLHDLPHVLWNLCDELGERVWSVGIVSVGAEEDNPPVRSHGSEEFEDEEVV